MMALINPPKRPQHLADDKMSPCTTQSAFPKQMPLSLNKSHALVYNYMQLPCSQITFVDVSVWIMA